MTMEEKIKEPVTTEKSAEEKTAEEKITAKSTDSKPDRLTLLKAKQEKAAAAVEKAAQKAKAIGEEIAAEEKKQHDREIKQLDSLCKSLRTELADVIALVRLIAEKELTVNEVSEMIGGKENV